MGGWRMDAAGARERAVVRGAAGAVRPRAPGRAAGERRRSAHPRLARGPRVTLPAPRPTPPAVPIIEKKDRTRRPPSPKVFGPLLPRLRPHVRALSLAAVCLVLSAARSEERRVGTGG